ncbi:MAG: hypothetical protein JWP01_4047 [Myxococcales bacterium]|nr:hypothetical protein [Myxococcales bacterium]
MRRLFATRALMVAVTLGGTISCGDTTSTPPSQLNFDRPVDIAFACYGGLRLTNGGTATVDQEVVVAAQPIESCNIRSGPHETTEPTPAPPGQENLAPMGGVPLPATGWYGFILQSAPGTVAVARFPTKPSTAFTGGDVAVLDSDPLTPGTNGISVGEDPIAIATDKVGCWEVIANAGSCDLSGLDINSALDAEPSFLVNRIPVKNANGEVLRAKPAAMVAEPAAGVIGAACPATPTGIMYVAYPGCHLVAAVDTSNGVIVGGVRYDTTTGLASVLQAADIPGVSCPVECDGGGTLTDGPRPVTLDLEDDERATMRARRLLIGADNSPSLTVVELNETTSLPESLRPIVLDNMDVGITSVAIAPEIGMGGSNGMINDELVATKFNFGYAIATDDTVRVVDLDNARECDTQVDPRVLQDNRSVGELSCLTVDPVLHPRRPGARGPGIELFGEAIPTSIDIFRSPEVENDARLTGPSKLIGYFGIITAANGATFVLNVDDDDYPDFENPSAPLEVQLPLAIAHQLRDAVPERNLLSEIVVGPMRDRICDTNGPDPDSQSGNIGGPRAAAPPTRNVPAGIVAAEKVGLLPYVRQVLCEGSDSTRPVPEVAFTAPDAVRDLTFPDLRTVRDETLTFTWEGSLSLDRADSDVDGPAVRVSQLFVDGGGFRMVDQSAPYCEAGVEQYDIVQLRGCDPSIGDADCAIGYTCFVHPNSEIAGVGACMLEDEADRLADACKDFLVSQRRYTVGRSASGELRLLPRKNVLRTTPVDGCVDDNQCKVLADYAVELSSASAPFTDTPADTHTWACEVDPDRAPLTAPGSTGKRCLETCTAESKCTTGRVCQIAAGQTEGYCMEGVTPPQACVNSPQRYELRAGEAFTVVGQQTGYVHSTIRDPSTGKCTRDPAAHPFDIGRLSLTPPACDPTEDPRTGRRPDGTFGPNPCSLTVDHVEAQPVYTDNQCTLGNPATMIASRQAPAVRFRNRSMTVTMVDPYYPGDDRCIRDRMGNLGKVPLVFPGYQVSWRQVGGFVPLVLPLQPAFPVKVVRGPTQSIWVIDEGDFLSTSISQPSTRGKVFRVEPQALGQVNILQ